MAKTPKHPNVNAAFFDGELDLIMECSGRCSLARFFTEPPEADDECAFLRSGQSCGHMPARLAALKALRERIGAEIEAAGDEEG